MEAAYNWMHGDDDLWFEMFNLERVDYGNGRVNFGVNGRVLPVGRFGAGWIDDYDAERIYRYEGGVAVAKEWVVKIEYNIGTVLDAANGLRQSILEEVSYDNDFKGAMLAARGESRFFLTH